MNETYQKPGKWNEQILYPSASRHDSRHFVMSYIIKQLEHNSVYEVMVQAKNRYGWNEVRKGGAKRRNFDSQLTLNGEVFLSFSLSVYVRGKGTIYELSRNS